MIRLPKLPDKTPIKLAITIMPDLDEKLRAYAGLYKDFYGNEESVSSLVPAILDAFLEGDREFSRRRKKLGAK
ncbi:MULTISPECIES: DUF2274 domain-containing protein [Sphingosinicella]|uniref:DUF2274 domain-containing protein n=1 Tax=Sphingosinicella TaxID=335405 RepID=UPI0017C8A45E|nr:MULTISPECIES: DUF2274 domain-containing protein [Sphingosinicella]MBA4757302.1 DUF2274 domain-containing protein [Sphingosinicella sp.]WBX83987.1 DUF2274 domain-containing protein [Sphingosinicella microcystinivorans]